MEELTEVESYLHSVKVAVCRQRIFGEELHHLVLRVKQHSINWVVISFHCDYKVFSGHVMSIGSKYPKEIFKRFCSLVSLQINAPFMQVESVVPCSHLPDHAVIKIGKELRFGMHSGYSPLNFPVLVIVDIA